MKTVATMLSAMLVLAFLCSAAQANTLCEGKEGNWIAPPTQDPNFGGYFLGGLCDNNSCYHVTISNDAEGEDMVGLAFTCEEIGDGSERILWVFVDVQSGEKQEVQANLMEINEILKETLNQ